MRRWGLQEDNGQSVTILPTTSQKPHVSGMSGLRHCKRWHRYYIDVVNKNHCDLINSVTFLDRPLLSVPEPVGVLDGCGPGSPEPTRCLQRSQEEKLSH